MSTRGWITAIVVLIIVFLFLCLGVTALILTGLGISTFPPIGRADSVALIHIEGVISSSPQGGLLTISTASTPEAIINQIRSANKDSRVAAILLRIDSPGGSAAASQEVYREVKRSKKPVVASIGDVGASGAYYIASGTKEIIASPASTVGSIGVIMTIPNLQDLYKKLGVSFVVITQGKYKDIGSESRPMTEEERKILTEHTAIVYEQFISDVAAGRGMSKERVRELATGLDWPASQALKLGLVDRLGNYQDALNRAGKLGKIVGEPNVVRYDRPTLLDVLTHALPDARSFSWQSLLRLLERQVFPAERHIPR
jgi:protease-4